MLKITQEDWAHDIFALEDLRGSYQPQGKFSHQQILQIYRNNYFESLHSALVVTFPTVLKFVGEEFFRMIALLFIKDVPFAEPSLLCFGSEFSSYLKQSEHCKAYPYLVDVAHLDWLLEEAYNAPEFTASHEINPSLSLIKSRYPVLALFKFDGSYELNLDSNPQNVMVWKTGYEVLLEKVNLDLIVESAFKAGNSTLLTKAIKDEWLKKGICH